MITTKFFHAYPQAAYLVILLIPFFFLFLYLSIYRKTVFQKLASQNLLDTILYRRPTFNYWRKCFLLSLAWVLATFALMDPKGNARYPESIEKEEKKEKQGVNLKRKSHEIIFLVDTSASMAVKDARNGQSRLDYAKEILDETIRRLNGESVSLYVFTSETNKQVPSTLDYIFTRLVLRNTGINEGGAGGTNLHDAINHVMNDYPSHPDEKLKTLIVFSDGGDGIYEEGSDVNKKNRLDQIVKIIDESSKKNLRVVTIGMGSREGGEVPNVVYKGQSVSSSLDPTILKELSKKGRGQYFESNSYGTLVLIDRLVEVVGRDNPFLKEYEAKVQVYLDKEGHNFIYDRYYQRPLGVAILLLLLVIIFPENWKREVSP